ncbi:phospholipid scramblase 2-like [Mya arenaria]|uniref:phospholipid scramblase 2-like n=1 Tax=Mya arenaria TaxID=6604 RepID=UPI0022E18B40|nr:phospholipid scramblase 2-like [Mya arenaria]
MHITDNTGMEVIRLQREFQCWKASCWCACSDCCAHTLTVEAPVGTTVGYVRQKCSVCQPIYAVQDYDHNELMTILGPCCVTGCSDIEFRVTSATDDQDIGEITKNIYLPILPMVNALTTADKFGVSFPRSLDIKQKATMIGACFLIDFMFFERPPAPREY